MNQGIHINDIFMWASDVEAMRAFYSGVLGFQEMWSELDKSKDGSVYVVYRFGNQNLHFINRSEAQQAHHGWAYQPSSTIADGDERLSFTIEMPRERLEKIAKHILSSDDIPHYQTGIEERDGYDALTVRDPMGNTLDLYAKQDRQ